MIFGDDCVGYGSIHVSVQLEVIPEGVDDCKEGEAERKTVADSKEIVIEVSKVLDERLVLVLFVCEERVDHESKDNNDDDNSGDSCGEHSASGFLHRFQREFGGFVGEEVEKRELLLDVPQYSICLFGLVLIHAGCVRGAFAGLSHL